MAAGPVAALSGAACRAPYVRESFADMWERRRNEQQGLANNRHAAVIQR